MVQKTVWGNISAKAVSPEFILEHSEYIDTITFDAYRIYDLDPNVSFRTIKKLTEYFIQNSFRFAPDFTKNRQ